LFRQLLKQPLQLFFVFDLCRFLIAGLFPYRYKGRALLKLGSLLSEARENPLLVVILCRYGAELSLGVRNPVFLPFDQHLFA
jgi:hypothetical protein